MARKQAKKAEEKAEQGNGQSSGDRALPLFYKNPTPLDAKRHAELALKKDFDLSFAQGVNAVPVNMIEMPHVCHYYPIAFGPDQNATPVALLGLRDDENLFLDKKGKWSEDMYIPSYIRRYPFIFSEMPANDQLTLCVDIDDTLVEDGGEQRFFDDKGGPTQLSQNALEFCKSYHAAAQQTLEFSRALAEKDLLIERSAEVTIPGDKKISLSGFRIVDEKKLSEIDDETFLDWRRKGWLPFIYAHLFSGAQWQRLTRMLNERLGQN
jgi:hypothetical protein